MFTQVVHSILFGLHVDVVAPSNTHVEWVLQNNVIATLNLDGVRICLIECSEDVPVQVWATGCAQDVRFLAGLGSNARHAQLVLVRNGTTFHISCSARGVTYVNVVHPDPIADL